MSRNTLIRCLMGALMGCALGAVGFGAGSWQFWLLMVVFVANGIVSTIWGWDKT